MGQRWYDPSTGRWLSRDPIGHAGGLNLYQYAKSSLNYVDPSGLSPGLGAGLPPTADVNRHRNTLVPALKWTGEQIILNLILKGAGRLFGPVLSKIFSGTRGGSCFFSASANSSGLTGATPELLSSMQAHGRTVLIATGEDLRFLDTMGAEAMVTGDANEIMILRPGPSKIAALEEFLHGTQTRLGIIPAGISTSDQVIVNAAEYKVKDFMIKHSSMLGLNSADTGALAVLRTRYAP